MIILGKNASTRKFTGFSTLSGLVLKLFGWKISADEFNTPKAVLAAGPHTSNWDFVFGMLMMMKIKMDLKWMGKAAIFSPLFKPLLENMGGIPITRSKNFNAVDQMIDVFNSREKICLALSPEGTRSKTHQWKSGFYHIAKGANVPIVIVYLDYKTKTLGFSKPFDVTGTFEETVEKINTFWSQFTPKRPEQY